MTGFFHDYLGYVFHDCHYPVLGVYQVLDYYVDHDETPLVRDSFPLPVTDFVHVTENCKVPEKHVIVQGSFQIFVTVFLLLQGLNLVHD